MAGDSLCFHYAAGGGGPGFRLNNKEGTPIKLVLCFYVLLPSIYYFMHKEAMFEFCC